MRKLLLFFFLLPLLVCAQDGTLDATFGTGGVATGYIKGDGTTNTVTANAQSDITKLVVQPDGKIVQVGYKATGQGDNFIIIRYNVDGTIDASFGTDAPFGFTAHDLGLSTNDRAHGVALQSDGKIVVVGETVVSGETIIAVTRYTTTGAIDNTFGTAGVVKTDLSPASVASCGAYAVKIDASDDIYVVGYSKQGTNNDFVLLKYSGSNGALITSFGSGGRITTDFNTADDAAADLVLGTNYIYVCGTARNGATDYFALASYTYAGAPNTTFNTTGKLLVTAVPGIGRSLAVSNNIYMTGYSTATPDFTTVSYTLTGTVNTGFGGTGIVRTNINNQDASRSILVQCDGKIVVGGELRTTGGTWYFAAARYSSTGALDNTFGIGGKFSYNTGGGFNDFGYSGLALQASEKLLLGGISITGTFFPSFHPRMIRLTNPSLAIPTPVVSPATACFTDVEPATLTASGGASYIWYLDGAYYTQTTANSIVTSTAGTYTAKINNGNCTGPSSNSIIVTDGGPPATLSPLTANLCTASSSIDLTASGGTIYKWYKDGNLIPGQTSSILSVSAPGDYYVYASNGSCYGVSSSIATIGGFTTPSLSGSGIFCDGSQINVGIPNIEEDQTYTWKRDGLTVKGPQDGSGGGQSYQQVMSASQAGQYIVYSTKPGCPTITSNTVNVYYPAITNLATTSITTSSVSFTWTSLGSTAKYEYEVSTDISPPVTNGTLTTSNSITKSLPAACTNYFIHVRVQCGEFNFNNTYSEWETIPFNNSSAPATPTASVTTQPTCAIPTGTITITSALGSGISYSLINSSSVTVGTTTTTSFSSVSPGSYSLTATNSCGTSTALTGLVVNAAPSAPATPAASVTTQPTCAIPTGTITITSPLGSGITYNLINSSSVTIGTTTGTSFTSVSPGTYSLTATNSCGTSTALTGLVVNAAPSAPATPAAIV
jgi:uncharacterized delta-60 repeat protein